MAKKPEKPEKAGKTDKAAKPPKPGKAAKPVAAATAGKPATPGEGDRGDASLCYGEPVREDGRTIIPVARVRRGPDGALDAVPRGYIEVGPEGTRFQAIDDPDATGRRLRSLAAATLGLLGALVGLRAARTLRGGDRRRLLGRGS
jgi:hypothetical protein